MKQQIPVACEPGENKVASEAGDCLLVADGDVRTLCDEAAAETGRL